MKIAAVTPSAAASSPSHPDHARWVKERTLALEIGQHSTLRDAESANMQALSRLASRKRKPKARKKARKIDTLDQLAKENVTVRPAPRRKIPQMPPCKRCRRCLWCKRAIRISMIGVKARQNDIRALALQNELNAILLAASGKRDYRDALGRELPFSRLVGPDVDRAVNAGVEWACDRSTSFMGQWR